MAISKITVTLPSDLEAFIDASVPSGRFAAASDAVREGLRLLEEREQERDAVLAELRQETEVGVAEAKAGQLPDGRTFFEELWQQVRFGVLSDFILTPASVAASDSGQCASRTLCHCPPQTEASRMS